MFASFPSIPGLLSGAATPSDGNQNPAPADSAAADYPNRFLSGEWLSHIPGSELLKGFAAQQEEVAQDQAENAEGDEGAGDGHHGGGGHHGKKHHGHSKKYSIQPRESIEDLLEYLENDVKVQGKPLGKVKDAMLWYINKANSKDFDKTMCSKIGDLKEALVRLATNVSSDTTKTCVALGELWLRTPKFFVEANLHDSHAYTGPNFDRLPTLADWPEDFGEDFDFDSPDVDPAQVIDDCYLKARLHLDGEALTQLLVMMKMPEDDFPRTALKHLENNALRRQPEVVKFDKDQMQKFHADPTEQDRNTAMTAHWPQWNPTAADPHSYAYKIFIDEADKGHVDRESYSILADILRITARAQHEFCQEMNLGKARHEELTKTMGDAYNEKWKPHHEFWYQPDHENKEAWDHYMSEDPVEQEDIEGDRKDEFEKELKSLDYNFKMLQSRDKNLHVSAGVAEVLLDLCIKGTDEVRDEQAIVNNEAMDQFARVNAADKICHFASDGNEIANDFLVNGLMKCEHWIIRRNAYTHGIELLGSKDLDIKDYTFTRLVGAVNTGLVEPIETPQDRDVVEAIVAAVLEEMPAWEPPRRKVFLDELSHQAEGKGLVSSPVVQKVLAARPASDGLPLYGGVSKKPHLKETRKLVMKASQMDADRAGYEHDHGDQ